jgi:hypothetical protein
VGIRKRDNSYFGGTNSRLTIDVHGLEEMLCPRKKRKKRKLPKVFWLWMLAALLGVVGAHLFYSAAREHEAANTEALTTLPSPAGSKTEDAPKNREVAF